VVKKKKKYNFWARIFVLVLLIIGFYYWRPLTRFTDNIAARVAGKVLSYYHMIAVRLRSVDAWFVTKRELESRLALEQQERSILAAQLVALQAQRRYENDIDELVQFRARYQQWRGARIVHIVFKHFGPDSHYFLMPR